MCVIRIRSGYEWAGELRKVEIAKGGHQFQFQRFTGTGMADGQARDLSRARHELGNRMRVAAVFPPGIVTRMGRNRYAASVATPRTEP